ncbi:MAG: DUF1834 family protein [Magnetococcales bacterium]|nr:DUF1834 family protein [Magnetococcales bacterium]
MIDHADIEDALLAALAVLHQDQGGPLRTLQASGAISLEELKQTSSTRPAPLCLAVSTGAQPSPLRPGNHYEAVHTITLLLAARSFRSRQTAVRGDLDRVGVYDLLAATRQVLLGRDILGPAASEMRPGHEWLLTSSPTLVIWGQEWQLTVYH